MTTDLALREGLGHSGQMIYHRPILQQDAARPEGALSLACGWTWFDQVEVLERGRPPQRMRASDLPREVAARLCAPRAAISGMTLSVPRLMGILNVTPDSFSDGGRYLAPDAALAQARAMAAEADLLDIGGESTRPGAVEIAVDEETARVAPVIAALRAAGVALPISVDTRKAAVAQAALDAGADLVNDVAALRFDPELGPLVAARGVPVVLMHSVATPATMQDDPRYDDVLLDVYDALAARIAAAEATGILRGRILVDPGIGFGKTVAHNLALLRGIALFHSLGCPILLGASRKRFIGSVAGGDAAAGRLPGSLAVALAGVAQGVQVLRVHDVAETRAALRLWRAVTLPAEEDAR